MMTRSTFMDPSEETSPACAAPVRPERAAAADDGIDRPHLRVAVKMLSLLVVVFGLLRVFVLEPYGIPTGSMRPTILEGDVLLVNKLPYTIRSLRYVPFTNIALPVLELPGLGHLERGDVVVFDFPVEADEPSNDGEQLVKRCAAIPGDTVELVQGRIRVNGREVTGSVEGERVSPIARSRASELLRNGGRIVVPFKGYEVPLDSSSAALWAPLITGEGSGVRIRNGIVFVRGLPATRYTFRRDYFFALGDNSADSHDSRFFGFVPVEDLVGQAWTIYWSREPEGGMRWDRIGTIIR